MTAPSGIGPLWWDKEGDTTGQPIRSDVRTAAHQVWDSARRQAQYLLGDASEAAELMENAVAQVSRYLDRAGPDLFTQNTAGILMCAFCRSLRRVAMKLNRLKLVGGISELSEQQITQNRTDLVELSLDLEKLSRKLTHKARAMLDLRARGFDWKEIAEALQMTDTAARTAFWREVRRARSKSLRRSPQERRE